MFGKISIRKSDTLFSKYIRQLRGNRCEVCGRDGRQWKMEASHFYGRVKENTRHDVRNVDCLCFICHKNFHANRKDYEAWKLKKLGKKEYNLLMLHAHLPGKKDEKLAVIYIQKLLAELEK